MRQEATVLNGWGALPAKRIFWGTVNEGETYVWRDMRQVFRAPGSSSIHSSVFNLARSERGTSQYYPNRRLLLKESLPAVLMCYFTAECLECRRYSMFLWGEHGPSNDGHRSHNFWVSFRTVPPGSPEHS